MPGGRWIRASGGAWAIEGCASNVIEEGATVDTCERCGGSLVVITINVAEGTRTLQSCSRCDRRSWRADGEPVKLDGVLADLSDDAAKRAEAMRR
jgi:hypothetical protein